MKKLLILPVLLLASCTTLVTKGAQTAQSTLATYDITAEGFVFRNLDNVPAMATVLVLDGVTTKDDRCPPRDDGVVACHLGNVAPLDSTAPVAFAGKITSGSLTWRGMDNKLRALPVAAQ